MSEFETALSRIEHAVGGESSETSALTALERLNFLVLELTAKGEEPCSLAKDPGHPGNNWVTEEGGLPP